MEDELRLFLLLGGTVFIIGVLAHGIWKIRKTSDLQEKTRLAPRQWAEHDVGEENDADSDGGAANEDDDKHQESFDELGLGTVRVVGKSHVSEQVRDDCGERSSLQEPHSVEDSNTADESDTEASTYAPSIDDKSTDNVSDAQPKAVTASVHSKATPEPKLYGSVVSNPKPHMSHVKGGARGQIDGSNAGTGTSNNVADFPEPPSFLLKEGEHNCQETGVKEAAKSSDTEVSKSELASQSDVHAACTAPDKLYVEPTEEKPRDNCESVSAHQREVADFSLDSPTQPTQSITSSERMQTNADEKPRRFSRTKPSKSHVRQRQEPNFGDDQMRIDFDDNHTDAPFGANGHDDTATSDVETPSNTEQEVLVLNVRAPEGMPIVGAALLPMLLTLGFKFGDQDIFHRHVNSNGKGPVLFSLANLFKPGVFDIDNLENFETQGVSLFMILPIDGDPHQVFNMMHNAARKLADEFGAQVLDGRRSVLTKQGLQQYVEKIREFERKRMIARN